MSHLEKYEVFPLFSKPVYVRSLDLDTKKIVSMIESGTSTIVPRGFGKTDEGKDSLYVLEEKKFKFLKDALMKEFNSFASDVMHYSNKFKITTSWFTKVTTGQIPSGHNHNNCMFSGVLYVQVDENTGDIVFQTYDNRRYWIDIEEHNVFNSRDYGFKPVDGLLLLFPSEVYHVVDQNKSDTTRYSLAFNVIPVGLIGDETSDSHMIIN